MVLCFIALPVFLILGIFSVKYRILTKDALECLGRTITLRKCKSGLDNRIKSHITGKVIRRNKNLGLFVYKNFQLLSIIFILLFVLSIFFGVTGYVNYVKYGNCYGPNYDGDGICVYSEILDSSSCDYEECTNDECNCEEGSKCICDNSCIGK